MLCVLLIIYTKFNLRRIINPRYENARRGLKPRQIFTNPPPPLAPTVRNSGNSETNRSYYHLWSPWGWVGGGGGFPQKPPIFEPPQKPPGNCLVGPCSLWSAIYMQTEIDIIEFFSLFSGGHIVK